MSDGPDTIGCTSTPDDAAERFEHDAFQRSIRQDGNNAVFPIDGASNPFAPSSLAEFRDAARALKQAESAVAQARERYAAAVKAMSEEAVR